MNWQSIPFDWNQARAFLATAEEGSLSAAARALGLTQPTLSRQVAALEEALGVTLFERIGRSLTLTQTGHDLLDHFRAMGDAAGRISLSASGQSQTIEGQVSIAATNVMATYHLPGLLKQIRAKAPGIEIIVKTANELHDLMRREADIAIRHARPEQPDLIAKLVGKGSAQLYASTDFLEKHGHPRNPADVAQMDFIGFETPDLMLEHFQGLGLPVTRDNFRIATPSGTMIIELVRQGLGIGFIEDDAARFIDGIVPVLPDLPPTTFPVWLVTHRELHTSRRIRVVFDLLADGLAALPARR